MSRDLINPVIEGSSNFMSESSSRYIITLPSLVAVGTVVVEIWCLLWLRCNIPHSLTQIRHYCLSLKPMTCHSHTYEILRRGHNFLSLRPMKDSRSWSHVSTRQLTELSSETADKKKKVMAITKRFVLHTNAKNNVLRRIAYFFTHVS